MYSRTGTCTSWNIKTLAPITSVLIFQVSLYVKVPFGTITKCVDYAGGLIIYWFHCIAYVTGVTKVTKVHIEQLNSLIYYCYHASLVSCKPYGCL